MAKQLEGRRSGTPLRQKATASLILVVASALAIWVAIGVVKAIFFTVVVIAAILGVLWALKVLLW
jgi:hypothetical protein